MFTSNDWVARAANLPVSTPDSRAAVVRDLKTKFASLPAEQKEWYAEGDLRWWALQDPILSSSDLRAKAVRLVQQAVHGPGEFPTEARALGNEGIKFHRVFQKYRNRGELLMGLAGDQMNWENLRNAKGPDLSVPPASQPEPWALGNWPAFYQCEGFATISIAGVFVGTFPIPRFNPRLCTHWR